MTVVVCVDDRGGMTFNGRRQSRDKVLCEDIINSLGEGERLCISAYSRILFENFTSRVVICDALLENAGKTDVCFVEDRDISLYLLRIDRLIIYRWNRHYPADTYFEIIPENENFCLAASKEFCGSSHEKITKEIYVKC